MKYIIAGTNRKNSRTSAVAKLIQNLYHQAGEKTEIIDLADLPFAEFHPDFYGKDLNGVLKEAIDKINQAEGLHMIVPEYNGSMPGALKYFIDFWKYPETFEFRPVAFVGLGGMFGGLRPVEHLQQVFGYRSAFIFPQRIFLQNVWTTLKDGQIQDPVVMQLLKDQVFGFQKFVTALKEHQLDANFINSKRQVKKS